MRFLFLNEILFLTTHITHKAQFVKLKKYQQKRKVALNSQEKENNLLSSKFNLKDREKLENVHDVVYQAKCPDCFETYIGETARRLEERVEEKCTYKRKNKNMLQNQLKRTIGTDISCLLSEGLFFLIAIASEIFRE